MTVSTPGLAQRVRGFVYERRYRSSLTLTFLRRLVLPSLTDSNGGNNALPTGARVRIGSGVFLHIVVHHPITCHDIRHMVVFYY